MKNSLVIKFQKAINPLYSKYGKQIVVIYLLAIIVSVLMFIFCPRFECIDTVSYLNAKDNLLLHGKIDMFRPPIYPLFLALTQNETVTLLLQNIIFLISIGFLYSTLKMLSFRPRLIFLTMLIYIAHPATFYNYQLLSESLSISLSTMYVFFMVRYIKQGKARDCWLFHLLALILILAKPAFVFLLGISVALFIYLLIFKRTIRSIFPVFLSAMVGLFICVGSYAYLMKKEYGVSGLSCVSDLNFYYVLGGNKLLDLESIPDETTRKHIETLPFSETCDNSLAEILGRGGWPELHTLVQNSIKKSYMSYLKNEDIWRAKAFFFQDSVGSGSAGHFWKIIVLLCSLTFYQLSTILFVYFFLIVRLFYKTHKIPIISVLFFIYIVANIFLVVLNAPNDYGRLVVPSLTIILVVVMQVIDWMICAIEKQDRQLVLE